VGKPEGKMSLGIYRCRLDDNIKMYLRKTDLCIMDCIYMAQDRDQWRVLLNMVMNLRVP
jgi:hypothetical protein